MLASSATSRHARSTASRVERTIADLAGSMTISDAYVAEAIGYRSLERRGMAA